jgi:HCOMODA/2-hydroxy-3-carboxy-muconic semialdehyde decarboxylase
MAKLKDLIDELVTANRILANEGIVDSFGHVSVRHPKDSQTYLLSRARAPELVEAKDILAYRLDGEPAGAKHAKGAAPYIERFIHGAIYEARPDVRSVVHNHSPSTIPFGVTGTALKPVQHMCASMGHEVPLWDSQDRFGDTALLVNSMEMGRDLAARLGQGSALLMRGHGAVVAAGSIRQAVFVSVYLERNAKLQMQAMSLGRVRFLSKGEVDAMIARTGPYTIDRAWEAFARRALRKRKEPR